MESRVKIECNTGYPRRANKRIKTMFKEVE
jgi:hypothetical protein